MLKRHQVLLEDWVVDHLKKISNKYDISFSEAIRLMLCLQIPKLVKIAYPEVNIKTLDKELVKIIKAVNADKMDIGCLHKVISKIYFNARKAMELWSQEENKKTKVKKKLIK